MNGQSTQPIYSSYASDETMTELIEMFVDELPDRAAVVKQAADEAQWDSLRSISHQLKGAAPGYGFEAVGEAAGHVERLVMDHAQADQVLDAVESLLSLCDRVAKS